MNKSFFVESEFRPAIALHGGAGTITRSLMHPEKEKEYRAALQTALHAGWKILEAGGSALDAVEHTVNRLEDCPLFNAGKGSVFNSKGLHEMDASIMRGEDRGAGAVSLITGIKNPISLARAVMEKTEHVLLAGVGAQEFAEKMGFATEPPEYFFTEQRYRQWQNAREEQQIVLDHSGSEGKKMGTVGAVALDVHGNLAAATSTGGMTNKAFGRVGDSPIIGAGTFADNQTCAVSCTGHGEFFIRYAVAYDLSCLMEYKGLSLQEACQELVMNKLVKAGAEGGLIAIDRHGNISLPFNSEGMYRASKNSLQELIAIYRDE